MEGSPRWLMEFFYILPHAGSFRLEASISYFRSLDRSTGILEKASCSVNKKAKGNYFIDKRNISQYLIPQLT